MKKIRERKLILWIGSWERRVLSSRCQVCSPSDQTLDCNISPSALLTLCFCSGNKNSLCWQLQIPAGGPDAIYNSTTKNVIGRGIGPCSFGFNHSSHLCSPLVIERSSCISLSLVAGATGRPQKMKCRGPASSESTGHSMFLTSEGELTWGVHVKLSPVCCRHTPLHTWWSRRRRLPGAERGKGWRFENRLMVEKRLSLQGIREMFHVSYKSRGAAFIINVFIFCCDTVMYFIIYHMLKCAVSHVSIYKIR